MKAIALQETKLTKDLVDSSQVTDPTRVFLINKETELEILAIAPQIKNSKRLVTFTKGVGSANYNSWYLWPAHWEIDGKARTDYQEAIATPKGTSEASTPIQKIEVQAQVIKPVNWSDSAALISQYFSVYECTKGEYARCPARGSTEEANILKMAQELDKIREEWGSAIAVTSWYRPPAVNRAIGGALYSQHLNGGAVDVYSCDGRDWEFEDFLNRHWGGGLGFGVASGRGFTHLDLREGAWRKGAATIRWTY